MRVSCTRRVVWEECNQVGRTARILGADGLCGLVGLAAARPARAAPPGGALVPGPAMEWLEPRCLLSAWGAEALAAGLIAPASPTADSAALTAPQRASDAQQAGAQTAFAASQTGVTAEVIGSASPYGFIGGSRLILMPRQQFVVLGTDGDDTITISQTPSSVTLTTPQGSTTYAGAFPNVSVYGFGGNDTIRLTCSVIANAAVYAGDGDDTVYDSGRGNDFLWGDGGDDTLVTIGGGAKTATGGAGMDSYWVDGDDSTPDATPDETAAGNVHRVQEFYGGVSMDIDGQALADPTAGASASGYANFASHPLFTDGPTYTDIRQGASSDCYLLAPLAALANTHPNAIRQMITSLGDGTYAVRFYRNGSPVYVRVDADLPVSGGTSLVYARLSPTGETWVALTEKAYADFRTEANTYASLESGWMGSACIDVTGRTTQTTKYVTSTTDADMYAFIATSLNAGDAVTMGSKTSTSSPIVGSHGYMVKAAFTAEDGTQYVTVYNPWGYDGDGSDSNPNDGLVTITLPQLRLNFTAVVAAA
jgi:hypothetical protein